MTWRKFFNNLSIKTKLSFVVMVTCTIVLVIISSVVLISEIYTSRASLVHEMRILSNSLVATTRYPLLLDRQDEAERMLRSLSQQNNIHAAYLFNRQGEPIAEYLKLDDARFVIAALENDFRITRREELTQSAMEHLISGWTHYSIFMPVMHDNRHVGTLYILSDLHALYRGITGIAIGGFLALVLLIAFSWLLAEQMQKPISAPLLELAGLMKEVSGKRLYSIRAISHSRDEIGTLVNGFNAMLEQIELHQLSLSRHQEELEHIVAERTQDLRSAIAELEIARKQADAANEAKSAFLSRMTHELRTPMIGVLGMNELLARTALDERQKMLVSTVQRSGEELLHLIKDILDFSRIEAGQLSLETADVELFQIIEDVVSLLAPRAAGKGLSLHADIPLYSAWKVRADDQRVRQVVMNLVGNAIKFTEHGSVRVSLRLGRIIAGLGEFTLEVVDTGPGMDEAYAERIFDVFYQIDGSNTREKSGAGLGLAIVNQLVELMNGQISVETTPGSGSCFRVRLRLPVVEQVPFILPADLLDKPALICAGQLSHVNVEQLLGRLRALGFQLVRTSSAAEVLALLSTAQREGRPFGMVIVAHELSFSDGTLLYEALASRPEYAAYRIIAMAEYLDPLPCVDSRLDLPVTWRRLMTTLTQSGPETSALKATPCESGQADADEIDRAGQILIVSSNVAKSELLRLTLESQFPEQVFVVDSIGEARTFLDKGQTFCVVVDVSGRVSGDLPALEFLSGTSIRLIGIADQTLSADEMALFDSCFIRPVPADLADYIVGVVAERHQLTVPGQVPL